MIERLNKNDRANCHKSASKDKSKYKDGDFFAHENLISVSINDFNSNKNSICLDRWGIRKGRAQIKGCGMFIRREVSTVPVPAFPCGLPLGRTEDTTSTWLVTR